MAAATETMMLASSRMPNTRQKLRQTSRQDLARAAAGRTRSSTTTGVTRLNMTENQMLSRPATKKPGRPMAT